MRFLSCYGSTKQTGFKRRHNTSAGTGACRGAHLACTAAADANSTGSFGSPCTRPIPSTSHQPTATPGWAVWGTETSQHPSTEGGRTGAWLQHPAPPSPLVQHNFAGCRQGVRARQPKYVLSLPGSINHPALCLYYGWVLPL